jgi:hypothetical protein
VHHARRRLGKDGHLGVQVVDVEATIGVCDHELGEAAGSVYSLSNQVQAVGRSGPTALDAATTGGGVVQGDLLPHPYVAYNVKWLLECSTYQIPVPGRYTATSVSPSPS